MLRVSCRYPDYPISPVLHPISVKSAPAQEYDLLSVDSDSSTGSVMNHSRGISPFSPPHPDDQTYEKVPTLEVPLVATGKKPRENSVLEGDVFLREVKVTAENVNCELITPQTHLHFGKLFTKMKYEKKIRILNNAGNRGDFDA